MADNTKNTIKGMQLNDGTQFDVSALSNESLKKIELYDKNSSGPNPAGDLKNNLVIGTNSQATTGTYGLKNVDIKSPKSVRLFTGSDEIKLMADGIIDDDGKAKYTQVHMKSCVSSDLVGTNKDKVIRMRLGCSELELNSKNAYVEDTKTAADISHLDITFKNDKIFTQGKLKATSIDIRGNATAPGTGGGIAVQIASCDSNRKENKFKIETDRKVDPVSGLCPSAEQWGTYYDGEGGQGIEIGTINSQFESLGAKEIRRLANSDVFAVTRSDVKMFDKTGTITTDPASAVKWDYQTQTDDSKDIKSDLQGAVKWVDLVNAALYLKSNGIIPSDGSFYQTVPVTNNLTNVTTSNPRTITTVASAYEANLAAITGTISVTVKVNNVLDNTFWHSDTGKVIIPAASLTGAVEINATAS